MTLRGAALIAALLAAVAAPVAADPVAGPPADAPPTMQFAFAPPIGTTLRYEVERAMALGPRRVVTRLVRDYRFERSDEGYRLWIELASVAADAEDRAGARAIEASAAPLLGVPYAVAISPAGEPLRVVDQADIWSRVIEGQRSIRAGIEADAALDPEARAGMLAMVDAVVALDPAGQRRMLIEPAEQLLAFAGRSVSSGVQRDGGTVALAASGDDLASITIRSERAVDAGAAAPVAMTVAETASHLVAPSSGLVHALRRERRIGAAGAPAAEQQVETLDLRWLAGWDGASEAAMRTP